MMNDTLTESEKIAPNTTDDNVSFMSKNKNTIFAFLLILLLTLLAYSNTFHASWHFDDYHSIVDNPILHIESLHPKVLYSTFFANPGRGRYSGSQLYRPVSCLSFAINWYFGKDQVTGYHVTNLLVHLLAALFIYLCSVRILESPNLRHNFEKSKYTIALISTALWALHPIQTQAVTYIVQRMASLSALFGLISMFLYMTARHEKSFRCRLLCFAGSAVACILSIGSKENGVLTVAGIGLLEMLLYQDISLKKYKRHLIWSPVICLFLVVAVMFYLDSKGVLSGYNGRSYTLLQRLMTEARVMWLYVSQILWPLPGRFSLVHDIRVSTSLVSPWTTLPAIMALIATFFAGMMQIRKRPLVALAILFFYLSHLVESTIIPLELVFEHRNYLPTAFLFLPVAQGCVYVMRRCRAINRGLSAISFTALIVIIMFLTSSTFLRNDVWATEKRLWENAIEKAPGAARSYQNLAYYYYEPIGRYDIALALYEKALGLQMQTPKRERSQIFTNVGVIYDKAGRYNDAYDYYMRALEISPNELKPRYNAAMALIGMNRFEDASDMADELISKKPEDKDSNNLKGSILLKMNRPEEALPYLEKSLNSDPSHYQALVNMGVALYQTGKYARSRKVLESACGQAPGQGLPLFCLIENRLRANDTIGAEVYLQKLVNSVTLEEIDMVLKGIGENPFLVPMSYEILAPFIGKNAGRLQGT